MRLGVVSPTKINCNLKAERQFVANYGTFDSVNLRYKEETELVIIGGLKLLSLIR